MKHLFLTLLLFGCSQPYPKYKAHDRVKLKNPFYDNCRHIVIKNYSIHFISIVYYTIITDGCGNLYIPESEILEKVNE